MLKIIEDLLILRGGFYDTEVFIINSLFSLFSQIAACNNKKIYNPEIKFVELKETTISKRSFFLFIYAPWCQHCKISIPLVKEEMKSRNDWFLLNGEYLSLEEHLYIKETFLKAVNKEDPY